jgi:hypothetical protein
MKMIVDVGNMQNNKIMATIWEVKNRVILKIFCMMPLSRGV